MSNRINHPYLNDPNRLGDVISALQAMATYKFYKMDFAGWADRISGDSKRADYWRKVFEEHPEFFRLDAQPEKASLVWRRQRPKRYDVDAEVRLTKAEFYALPPEDKLRVSREPLTPDDIKALIDTAIDLHSRSIVAREERRWWISPVVSASSALLGALIGAVLSK